MKKGNNKKDKEKDKIVRTGISQPQSTMNQVKKIKEYESARSASFAIQKAIGFYYKHLISKGLIKAS